ncbi:MAG: tetratricopeptide repeat protein [Phycisphaerae bacterium]|nr:tetratricopeptide repeat protein [Phycisphaerae bacterium]
MPMRNGQTFSCSVYRVASCAAAIAALCEGTGDALAAGAAASAPTATAPVMYAVDAWTAYQLGCAKFAAGDLDAAIHDLRIALAKRPDEVAFATRLGEVYLAAANPDAAHSVLDHAMSQHPADMNLRALTARAAAGKGEWRIVVRLLAEFESRVRIEDRLLLADAYRALGRAHESAAVIERTAENFGHDARVALAGVRAALADRQPATALQRCDLARLRGVGEPRLDALRAEAWLSLGNIVGQAQKIDAPGVPLGARRGEGVIFSRGSNPTRYLSHPQSALSAARRAQDAGEANVATILCYARCWAELDQPALAWGTVQPILQRILESPDGALLEPASAIALRAGELSAYLALREATAARDVPRRAELLWDAYRIVAEQYNVRGDEAMSIAFLERAYEQRPDHVATRLSLAHAYWAAQQQEKAAEHYQALLLEDIASAARAKIMTRLESMIGD